jgi:hypothetical protein
MDAYAVCGSAQYRKNLRFWGGLVALRRWILRSLPHSVPKTSLLSVFQNVSPREKGFFDSLVRQFLITKGQNEVPENLYPAWSDIFISSM